jgi:hypothetical protein
MDAKADAKKDMLADVDLAALNKQREEAVKKQKETATTADNAKAAHFVFFWIGGCVLGAIWLSQERPDDPAGMYLYSACLIFAVAMLSIAFAPTLTARRRQDEASAATRQVKAIDDKIAFCHQVLEEAKKVKVRKYAEALVEKQTS